MEGEGRTGDEVDHGGRGEGEATDEKPKESLEREEADHSDREVSGVNFNYKVIKVLTTIHFTINVHLIRHRQLPEDAGISGLDSILIDSNKKS